MMVPGREAYYYSQEGSFAICSLCPHGCKIADGKSGVCRTRMNNGGKLYTLAYGNPCAVNIDPIEKKPLYHFYPSSSILSLSTAGCNLRCLNCQNYTLSQVAPSETSNYDMLPEDVIRLCLDKNCESIAYTYGEPIVYYEYTIDTAKLAHELGIRNVIVSAGYINEKPLRELCQYIDAANIDLKSFDEKIYKKLNGVELSTVLNTLKIIAGAGIWLEITNLIIPGYTDDFAMIRKMCEWLVENKLDNCPLHFSRFSPLYKLSHLQPTSVESIERARNIALETGIKYVYAGNVRSHEGENTYCSNCHKQLIVRHGYSVTTFFKTGTDSKSEQPSGRNGEGVFCSGCGIMLDGVF